MSLIWDSRVRTTLDTDVPWIDLEPSLPSKTFDRLCQGYISISLPSFFFYTSIRLQLRLINMSFRYTLQVSTMSCTYFYRIKIVTFSYFSSFLRLVIPIKSVTCHQLSINVKGSLSSDKNGVRCWMTLLLTDHRCYFIHLLPVT